MVPSEERDDDMVGKKFDNLLAAVYAETLGSRDPGLSVDPVVVDATLGCDAASGLVMPREGIDWLDGEASPAEGVDAGRTDGGKGKDGFSFSYGDILASRNGMQPRGFSRDATNECGSN